MVLFSIIKYKRLGSTKTIYTIFVYTSCEKTNLNATKGARKEGSYRVGASTYI